MFIHLVFDSASFWPTKLRLFDHWTMRNRTNTTTFQLISTNLCHIFQSDPVSFLFSRKKNAIHMHKKIRIKKKYTPNPTSFQLLCVIVMIYLDVNVYKSEGVCVQERNLFGIFRNRDNVCSHCDTRSQRAESVFGNFKHFKQTQEIENFKTKMKYYHIEFPMRFSFNIFPSDSNTRVHGIGQRGTIDYLNYLVKISSSIIYSSFFFLYFFVFNSDIDFRLAASDPKIVIDIL